MPQGRSLHIGLNSVDPGHYQGWSGPLVACEADANDMQAIAVSQNFAPTTLLTEHATRERVKREISQAAQNLEAGDIFFLSYSGHGGQLPDWNGDEIDQQDETWCLYDGQLVDDEIFDALAGFQEGVRVLALSDSCHSGTVLKLAFYRDSSGPLDPMELEPTYRAMPNALALPVYQANRALYDPIQKNEKLKDAVKRVKASALLLSGCQDNQLSMDGQFNGLFTGTLRRVWSDGIFHGSYRDFHSLIVRRMPPDQSPNYFTVGRPNPEFEEQTPFTI